MIETSCPHCGTAYRLKPELAGRMVRCKTCQESFEIPPVDTQDDEDSALHTIETRPIAANPRRHHSSGNHRTGVDQFGFLTHFDDDDDEHDQAGNSEEDDLDDDERIMQEAARRGAQALYEPRKPVYALPRRRSNTGPLIPKEVFLGFGGLIVGGVLLFFLVNFLSNINLNAALSGLPVEIQSEFEQNDPEIGSPAPESVKQFKTLTVRDTSKHKELIRKMTATINQAADIMSRIQDQQSAQANQAELLGFQTKISEFQMEAARLFNPNPKEDREIGRAVGDELVKAADRMATQARRIASISNDPFASMKLGTMERGISTIKSKYGSDVASADNPDAYVEVRVAGLKNKDEREYIAEVLRELASPKSSRTRTNSMSATRYALWPVDRPSVFAKKITFGKVIRTTGREVWVVANPIDPAVIKERIAEKEEADRLAKEAREKALANANSSSSAGGGSSGSSEPEIPPNADDVTKGLILVTKSPSIFKRRDGAQLLRSANLSGREDELLEALTPILDERDPFLLRDVIDVIKKCDSPKRTEILTQRLSNETNRDEVIKALGEIKDPKSIEPLVEAMRYDTWGKIDKIIIGFGADAEPLVIQQLGSGDSDLRKRACDILAEIGTDVSLKAFRKLPADSSFVVRNAANNAIRAIQNRNKLADDGDKPKK